MFVDKNDRRRETWRWQDAPPDMGHKLGLDRDPMKFDRILQMSFACFQHIVNWVVDEGNPNRSWSTPFQMWYKGASVSSGTCVTVSTVVGCGVLYFFSEASEMKDCKLLGVEPSTFHSYADMVVEELFSRSSEVICFPPKEKQVCMRCSMMDAPFPGALFAMDGTLCMLTTKGKHNEYVGRKSLPQMSVLVVCDWNMNLVHIDSIFTGRTQDNNMYMSSALHFAIDGENSLLHPGGFIIADEGFACREHILRPYNKRADDLEKTLFNFVFKSTRLLVENAIGAWKQKCPLLNIGMHKMEPEELAKTILASGVLYQLWKMTNEKVMNVDTKMYTDKAKYNPSRFIGKRGVNLRDEVKRFLCDNCQEALQILSTYTPEELMLLQS